MSPKALVRPWRSGVLASWLAQFWGRHWADIRRIYNWRSCFHQSAGWHSGAGRDLVVCAGNQTQWKTIRFGLGFGLNWLSRWRVTDVLDRGESKTGLPRQKSSSKASVPYCLSICSLCRFTHKAPFIHPAMFKHPKLLRWLITDLYLGRHVVVDRPCYPLFRNKTCWVIRS